MRKMRVKEKQYFSSTLFGVLLAAVTCIFLLLCYENIKVKSLEKKCKNSMISMGYSQSSWAGAIGELENDTFHWSTFFNEIPLAGYLSSNKDNLNKLVEQDATGLSLLYPGNSCSDNPLWSGAASDYAMQNTLFELSDDAIMLAKTNDTDRLEAEVEKENQSVRKEQNSTQQTEQTSKSIVASLSSKQQKQLLYENNKKISTLKNTLSAAYLIKNFYIVDSSTAIDPKLFRVNNLLSMNMKLKKKNEPQILIFHTHGASESFCDSKPGKEESIVGVGSQLAKILNQKYGYNVIHDTTEYDRIGGRIDRNKAYNKAYIGVKKQLMRHPGIQIVIDMHRDGVGNRVHRLTTINGRKTAQIMFFNGLSRNRKGAIPYLYNHNLAGNLSFSLQLKLACMKSYPDFAKPVYLKGYRYNLHLRKRSTLIELGNENNTFEEAKNAMEPLARVMNQVLSEN